MPLSLSLFLDALEVLVRQPLRLVVTHQHVLVRAPAVIPLHHVVSATLRISHACHGMLETRLHFRFCEGVGDVVGVVTPLGGVAQVIFHGVKVVEVGVVLRVHQDRGEEEDGEGQVEVEREEGEVKERRSCVRMG